VKLLPGNTSGGHSSEWYHCISPFAGQQAFPLLHALCGLLCFGAKLTLANMNMAATIAIRAAAVFIIPDGCSISFLHHVHN